MSPARLADAPSAKARPPAPVGTFARLLELQRVVGNRAVRSMLASPAAPLPHLDTIQRSFGRHDVSGVRAHFNERATVGLGARAVTFGEHVAFGAAPSVFIAAHEAAHVIQQRAGVHLDGARPDGNHAGVRPDDNLSSASGDRHERLANDVARQVALGRSAETSLDLLGVGRAAPGGARGGPPVLQRLAFDAAQDGTMYDLIIDRQSRQARFLGTDTGTRNNNTEYWFQEANGDTFFVYGNGDALLFANNETQVRLQILAAITANVTDQDITWALTNRTGGDLFYLMSAMAIWNAAANDLTLVKSIVAVVDGKPLRDIVVAARTLLRENKASDPQLRAIVNKYLTGSQRAAALITFLTNMNGLSTPQSATFLHGFASWLLILLRQNNLLELVLRVPGVDRGLAALSHAHYLYDPAQRLLEMLEHQPNVDFATLEWVASAARPSGNSAQERAASGAFIHAQAGNAGHFKIAKKIVRDMAQVDQARIAILDYVTNNGVNNNATQLDQRFIAIRAGNGNAGLANAGLAANYQLVNAQAILAASQVPHKHVANNSPAAYAKCRNRDEGTTSNSCTMSGNGTMEREILRVMQHYRGEIYNLANGASSRLMTLAVAVNENIWFRQGPAGNLPVEVPWRTLEVVIAKNGQGGLVLVHAQPNGPNG